MKCNMCRGFGVYGFERTTKSTGNKTMILFCHDHAGVFLTGLRLRELGENKFADLLANSTGVDSRTTYEAFRLVKVPFGQKLTQWRRRNWS